MSGDGIPAWWKDLPPEVEALARKISARHGNNVDALAVPYTTAASTTGGEVALIDLGDVRPLWTYEIPCARDLLAMVDEMGVDRVLPPAAMIGTFTDPTDLTADWRKETGLDGTDTEE
jgi:hypothetical protein